MKKKVGGRLKATAQIGDSIWKTAIWFDTKLNTYLLPLKAAIRKKELIEIDKKYSRNYLDIMLSSNLLFFLIQDKFYQYI
jgi:hypothetical protein